MFNKIIYNPDFFKKQTLNSYKSAEVIVPLLINYFEPKSVIDVGCGLGTWLKVFIDHRITDVLGIDGEYVDIDKLFISKEKFITADLTSKLNIMNCAVMEIIIISPEFNVTLRKYLIGCSPICVHVSLITK